MIKSHYTDLRFDNHGFVKHVHHMIADCGVIPGTTTPLREAYQIALIEHLTATSGTGGKPRSIALFRKVLGIDPTAGAWQFLEMWTEGTAKDDDYEESIAAGAWVLIAGWSPRLFAAAFVAFALLLVLPALLPKLLGG